MISYIKNKFSICLGGKTSRVWKLLEKDKEKMICTGTKTRNWANGGQYNLKNKRKNETSGDKIKRKRKKSRKNRETYTDKSLLLCFCGSSVNTTAFSMHARLNLP